MAVFNIKRPHAYETSSLSDERQPDDSNNSCRHLILRQDSSCHKATGARQGGLSSPYEHIYQGNASECSMDRCLMNEASMWLAAASFDFKKVKSCFFHPFWSQELGCFLGMTELAAELAECLRGSSKKLYCNMLLSKQLNRFPRFIRRDGSCLLTKHTLLQGLLRGYGIRFTDLDSSCACIQQVQVLVFQLEHIQCRPKRARSLCLRSSDV